MNLCNNVLASHTHMNLVKNANRTSAHRLILPTDTPCTNTNASWKEHSLIWSQKTRYNTFLKKDFAHTT